MFYCSATPLAPEEILTGISLQPFKHGHRCLEQTLHCYLLWSLWGCTEYCLEEKPAVGRSLVLSMVPLGKMELVAPGLISGSIPSLLDLWVEAFLVWVKIPSQHLSVLHQQPLPGQSLSALHTRAFQSPGIWRPEMLLAVQPRGSVWLPPSLLQFPLLSFHTFYTI